MGLTKFTPETDIKSGEVNDNVAITLTQNGRNLIRQLQDRDVDFSADGGEWAEAYVNATGQKDSVDTSETTAIFDTNKYQSLLDLSPITGTDHTDGSWSNVGNAWDDDLNTAASFSTGSGGGTVTRSIGKTFSSKNVGSCFVKVRVQVGSSVMFSGSASLQVYDGSSWNTVELIGGFSSGVSGNNDQTYQKLISINDTVQGIRVTGTISRTDGSGTIEVFEIQEGDEIIPSIITHDISTNLFSPILSSAIGVPLLSKDVGSIIQFKLRNDVEDIETPWLNSNEIAMFTGLGHSPDQVIVKLEGDVEIKGFSVFGQGN